jgi:hypothetical protein
LPNLGGAVNKFIQGYTQPIEGVFNFALDRLDSDGKVNRALEKPKMYEQELAKSKELKDQINQLKAKPKLTVQEATELSQKQQELQVQKPFKEVVDGSFSLLGQVIGQAALSEVGTPFVSSALNGVKIGTKTIGFTDKANKIATYASEIKNIKGASASMVAYASSYSDAEKEAINLGLDGWKKALYSNVIAGLNAGTERIFKDEKVLDAFNAEVSPLIGDMIQNLTTRGVTDAVLSRELRTIITKTLPKFAKNMVVENQKEAVEELATQLGTSITKGLLAPDQFNTQEELDAMKQVWYETTIYGGITSFGAAVTETRNSNVSKKAMYELGSNNAEINKFIDVVNTQVSKGKMSQEDANDKIKAVNTMQQIVQKSIPLIDSKRKLTSSEKVKLSNILLAERKLQDEIKNPNFSDVKSLNEKELSKVQDLKNKILNNEVFIDDNLDVYTEDEYNAKRDAENATPSNKIIQYNNDGTLTIKDANGVFIENFNGTIDEYYKKQVESTAKAEIEKIQEEIDSYDEEYNGLVDLVNKEDRKLNTPKSENEIKLNQLQNKIQKLRDRRDKLKSEPLLSNEQLISTTQSGSNPTTLKNGDKYTDAKGVERIWGENTEADKTHEIEQMLKATAEGAAMGATIQSVEDFKSGKETIFRKPQSIEAAKNNPNYNVEIQSDGSAKVIGVLDPRNNEWVGKSPSTKSENSKVTIDNIDELLKNDVARLQISSDGNKVDFNMFDVVIDRESNTAEVSFIEKKNRDKNKGIGVLAYIELAKKLNEQGISLVTSGNNPKMIGGDSIWNKLTKLGITERYGNKGNKINIDKLLEQQTTSTTQSESSADEIERRRPTAYIRDSKDKKSSLETFRNEAKREWDGVSVITGDRMKNLYVGIQLFVEAYPEYKELLNKFIKKENGTIGITNNNLSFVLNTLKKQGVTTESELGSKINAKYDAELDALKSKLTPVSAKEQIESANVQLDEVQSIQSQIDELVAKRKAEYDNALVGKENLSQTVKDNLNKKISANYNPQIDVLQKRLDEIAKNNVEAKVESNPTTTESKSTDADNAKKAIGNKALDLYNQIINSTDPTLQRNLLNELYPIIKNTPELASWFTKDELDSANGLIKYLTGARGELKTAIDSYNKKLAEQQPTSTTQSESNPALSDVESKFDNLVADKLNSDKSVFELENDFPTSFEGALPKTSYGKRFKVKKDGREIGSISLKLDKNGNWGISYVDINKNERRKGYAEQLYKDINKALVKNNQGVLHSDSVWLEDESKTEKRKWILDGKELTEDEITELKKDIDNLIKLDESGRLVYKDAVKSDILPPQQLWEKLVNQDLAEKLSDGRYKFKESLLSKEQTPAKKESPVFDDKNKTKEEIVITPKKVDILDEVTDEKIGEKEVSDFKVTLNDGASAFGVIEGEVAKIVGIQAPKKEGSVIEPKRGTKTYERVIDKLREKGIKTIQVSLQSQDSQKALSGLVEKGIIGNARDMQGVSDSQFPTTFDILSKEQTPTASDVESVAKDNDTEESIKEKLKNPFGKKVVIEGVEYTITDVGRGAGSPDITLTDKDGNIFYEEQKTFDGRIIKKLPTKSTLIDIAKNQKPTENLAEQAAETPEQSIKEIELKRDSDVRELSKYRIEINLPTIKEIVNSKDPIGNKWKYSAIKEKITMLDKLINCL